MVDVQSACTVEHAGDEVVVTVVLVELRAGIDALDFAGETEGEAAGFAKAGV
jgi:hypothetical protein